MRIGFLGLDEVNRYFTRKWARRADAGLKLVDVQAQGVRSTCPALVVDLDSLPESHRRRWIGWLTSFACQTPALVFGYTVKPEESDALLSRGVRVIPRALRRGTLQRWLERELITAA